MLESPCMALAKMFLKGVGLSMRELKGVSANAVSSACAEQFWRRSSRHARCQQDAYGLVSGVIVAPVCVRYGVLRALTWPPAEATARRADDCEERLRPR